MALMLVPAILRDAIEIAPRLRPEDAREVLAASGHSPEQAMIQCFNSPGHKFSVVDQSNLVVSMLGITPEGFIWMLASKELEAHRLEFLRWSRPVVDRLAASHDGPVWCFVDERNSVHHRWLQWVGFTWNGEQTTFSDPNVQFLHFIREG